MQAQLRPYQAVGVNWLWFLARLGLGGCLADDMGLGKTLQMLALLLKRKTDADRRGRADAAKRKALPNLLVVPASLLANWRAEIERFTPALTFRDRPSLRGGGAAGVAEVAGGTARGPGDHDLRDAGAAGGLAAAGVERGHSG